MTLSPAANVSLYAVYDGDGILLDIVLVSVADEERLTELETPNSAVL